MKTTSIFFILLFLSFFTYSQEYQYVPFPDSNAVWSEMHWKPISEPCPGWVYYKNALFNEDTIINGINYHKLFTSGKIELSKEASSFTCGIREDSTKKVWIKFDTIIPLIDGYANEYGEFLLYDFDLAVGDFFSSFSLFLNNESIIVKSIDTVKINNVLRKRFLFGNDIEIIEGLGNTQGLLICSPEWPTNGMNNDLICFHQNDTLLYYNSGPENIYDGCVPSFVLNDVSILPNPEVKVYPNPVTGESVYFEGLDFDKLELYDNNSHLVLSIAISGLDKYVLAISAITPGIYFYQLKKQGLVPTGGKLIIP